MKLVFGGGLWPLGWEVGFVEAPFAVVMDDLRTWQRGYGARTRERRLPRENLLAHLAKLTPLQVPALRQLVVETSGGWTAHISNDVFGTSGPEAHLSSRLGCRSVTARHIPADQYPYPSTQLELFGPDGPPPLHYVRTISCGIYDSGRWSFEESGERQPFERTVSYDTKVVRERFTRDLLLRYLEALGIHADDPDFYGRAVLVEERRRVRSRSATIDEARREHRSALA